MKQHIEKLTAIRVAGLLGDIRAHFAMAARDLDEGDPIAKMHDKLDAEEIGRAAHEMLGVDASEASALALEYLSVDEKRKMAIDLINEFYEDHVAAPKSTEADQIALQRSRRHERG